MALEYGYVITIEKDGTAYPETTPTNQWQKRDQGGEWSDIVGETGLTYVVDDADRSCDIRLSQDFGGATVRSNFLTVTSDSPGCPYKDVISETKISPLSATEGDTISIVANYEVSGLDVSQLYTQWFGSGYGGTLVSLQTGGDSLVVSNVMVIQCKDIYVQQRYDAINNSNPECNLQVFSNKVDVLDLSPTSFGNTSLSGPLSVGIGETATYVVTYDGNVVTYEPTVTFTGVDATYSTVSMLKNRYEFAVIGVSAGRGTVKCSLESKDANTQGTNPVVRAESITIAAAVPPAYLGNVTIEGPSVVGVGGLDEYEIKWDGTALAGQVNHQWASSGSVKEPIQKKSPVSWSTASSNHFIAAQVTYDSDFAWAEKTVEVKTLPWKNSGKVYHIIVPSGKKVKTSHWEESYRMDGTVLSQPDLNGWTKEFYGPLEAIFIGDGTRFRYNNSADYDFSFGPQTNTSEVTEMAYLVSESLNFNSSTINFLDTSRVTNMMRMFNNARAFNQDISGWDVSKVRQFYNAFNDAVAFNKSLSSWNTERATNMSMMFYDATSFNQDLSKWCVPLVTSHSMTFVATQMDTNYAKHPKWGTCP